MTDGPSQVAIAFRKWHKALSFREYRERLGNGMLPARGNHHGGTLQLLEHL